MRVGSGVALALLLTACGGRVVPPASGPVAAPTRPAAAIAVPDYVAPGGRPFASVPIAPQPVGAISPAAVTALQAGVLAGPPLATLPIVDTQAARSLAAFRTSCNALIRRTDATGLTRGSDWQPACDAARGASDRDAARFFGEWFEAVQVGDGRATATGYYEPEIAGSRERRDGYPVPIYGRPDDLIEVDLSQFSADLKGKRIRGKVSGRSFVPYDDRAAIDAAGLDGRARIIAWAADPVEVFFLQIQGSGRLRLPDGGIMRVGYESQNGRDYTGIGALMLQRGLLAPGQGSMQGIMAYLRANPGQGRAIMEENKSFVFFRELNGPPLGALGLPVVGGASAAADPRFVPLGAPVLLSMDRSDANGVWIAQDTGGAIKGPNRIDTFWGAGENARATAGGMKARGTAWVLVPRGTLARLSAEGRLGGAPAQP
ncbi:MAG: murein transglycosylase A [Pseudomonadota bacterium]